MKGQTRFKKLKLSLQTTILLLVCFVIFIALITTDLLISASISKETQQAQAEKATDIARIVARNQVVIEGLRNKIDESRIQTVAEDIRRTSNVEFVVVMDMKGIRKSHPNIHRIGEHFVGGDEGVVLKGKEHTSIAKGTLGVSLRAFTPVFDHEKKQIGAVAVGISLKKVNDAVAHSKKMVSLGLGFGIIVGVAGALLLARKIKTILFGLEPNEIAKLLEERSAMLQSTKEGILAIDSKGSITLVNNEAIRLFQEAGIQGSPIGKKVESFLPGVRFSEVFEIGIYKMDQEQELNGISILVNQAPVIVKDRIVGEILTFRDKTEIKQLADQLTGPKLYAEALRAQSHEFMNKMHVILGLIQIKNYKALSSYITLIVDHQQSEIEFVVEHFKDPVLAGFILGKQSFAREAGVDFKISGEGVVPEPKLQDTIHEIITILGNLIDNSIEAVENCPRKWITLRYDYFENTLVFEVHDTGKGFANGYEGQIFERGYSTKGKNRGFGLSLVKESLEKLNGEIEILSDKDEGTTMIVSLPYT